MAGSRSPSLSLSLALALSLLLYPRVVTEQVPINTNLSLSSWVGLGGVWRLWLRFWRAAFLRYLPAFAPGPRALFISVRRRLQLRVLWSLCSRLINV